ncbi:MAG: redoxin family protein [Acetobacteraceae bacterium]|nr:redoxin family protein [Acetobacteraceae bacterium]
MFLLLLAYLGGALTILSPCILPVLPFVFARADRPFSRSGLPMLAGMALTFAAVATLAAVAGGWAVAANQFGRLAAIVLLAFFGLTLLFPGLSDWMTRPLVRLGNRLSNTVANETAGASVLPSLLLGVATGLLWAPCAGPVLGLILTGAALGGASLGTTLLLLAYAAGAATSLALALLVGGWVFAAMKRSLGAGEWIRRGLGVAVLAGVAVIALGLDTGVLTQVSLASTAPLEQSLVDKLKPETSPPSAVLPPDGSGIARSDNATMAAEPVAARSETLPVEGTLPSLAGATEWLNSPPLTADQLKGKVVLIDFWTYSCINCLRSLPYVRAWAEKYKDQGLVVIGVHAPEFAFEKQVGNVRKAVGDLGITYPVAIDNNYAIWRAFNNNYWPAHYFVDARGRIRYHHFGEGEYDRSEAVIQQLLSEAGKQVSAGTVSVAAAGAEAASEGSDVLSPETYIGIERAENFVSPGGEVAGMPHSYQPGSPRLNEWGLRGDWTIGGEQAGLNGSGGGIVYRFHARDLHLVLGPGLDGKPVRFRVTLDGAAPGDSHGADTGADGRGVVTDQRLYQLVRQTGPIADQTFEITFEDAGVQAYAFTFG